MEERLTEGPVGMDASPISTILSELSKSTLDSGGKKRNFQRSKGGTFGASRRVDDQRSEGFINVTTNNELDFSKRKVTTPLRWRKLENKGYECDKENSGATNILYKHTPQKARCKKSRCPLENCELNNHDSDNAASPINDKEEEARREFHVAANTAMEMLCSPIQLSPLPASQNSLLRGLKTGSNLLRSLSSGYESMDDGLVNELIDMEAMDDETQLPSGISKLLSGDIVAPETSMDCDVSTTPEFSRNNLSAKVKRWLLQTGGMHKREIHTMSPPLSKTPTLSRIRTCLFRSPTATCSRTMIRSLSCDERSSARYFNTEVSPLSIRSFKRRPDEVPADETSILKRSRKSNSFCATPESMCLNPLTRQKVTLQRSLSETETHANVKWAIHRSITDSDLIGDFSKPCVLPLTIGHHTDLKTITAETLVALLRGEFTDRVNSYRIIDCRYPYEYNAGHIAGALNLYNGDLVENILFDDLSHTQDPIPKIHADTDKRNILVFHCEFSWERGPNLSRLLRRIDRERNKEHYPALYYPEIYLLQGGYKKFYIEQKEFCLPQDYKPMRHPNHEEEFKFFRSKAKLWQGDKLKGLNQTVRANFKRLNL